MRNLSLKEEAPMNDRSTRSVTARPIKERKKLRSKKQTVRRTDWELTDERLDDALRQTFPASDALSIIQNVRRR
jgi:hypothetical protein